MLENIINVQDAFLNYTKKNKISVTVFLLNGVKLTGAIAGFDEESIILKRDGYTQLVYKHAISTFSPHGSVTIFDNDVAGESSVADAAKSQAEVCAEEDE